MAAACAFLAFKVEEAHQKLYKVVSCARDAWHAPRGPVPPLTPAQETALHQSVIEAERCIMYTLEFDIGVVHPYAFINAHLKRWKLAGVFEPAWARSAKNCDAPREVEEALALASNLAFQTLTMGLHLRFSPQDLAAATLSLAFDVLHAKKGGGGGGGGGGSSSSSGGGGRLQAQPSASGERYTPSPIRPSHFALCSGVSGLEAIAELRAAIPACLGLFVVGDSAVRQYLNLQGGVAPVAAAHTVEGWGSARGGVLPTVPAELKAAFGLSFSFAGPGGGAGDDAEEAPQLAPAGDA